VLRSASAVDEDRGRLVRSKIFMNHTPAWGLQELTNSDVGRLHSVVARLMYLHSLAVPGGPSTVFCDADACPQLRDAVASACKTMERELIDEPATAQGVVVHVVPEDTAEAIESKMKRFIQECPSTAVFYVLCGDSEVLPAPTTEEEDTARGLSALGIGRALYDVMKPAGFVSGPHVVCEFSREQVAGSVDPRVNISSHQLDYLCEGQRCMQVTETWKLYGAEGGAFMAQQQDEVGDQEDAFWQNAMMEGHVCGNCGLSNAELRCSRCRKVSYCDRNCQKANWKKHKPQCMACPATPYAPVSVQAIAH